MQLAFRAAPQTCFSPELRLSGLSLAVSAFMGGGQTKRGLTGGMKAGGDTGKEERQQETVLVLPLAAQGQLPVSAHTLSLCRLAVGGGGGQVSSLFLFSLHCPGNILYSQLIPFNYTTIKHIIKT